MAGRALQRMPIDAVDIAARRQQFVPLAIATLGNAGTDTDGFDAMFTEAAQHAAEHLGFAETLTPDLKDADFIPGQILESSLGPTAKDFQAFTGAGTSVLDSVTPPTGGGQSAPEVEHRLSVKERIAEGLPPTASGPIHGRISFLDPYEGSAHLDSPI